ncbi:hypothetical protein GAYE_SCF38G5279 [Galdieria yellowstonensis]|uniref:Uncharacterized protein n=1 Tax=Galdieria yellowstonensis TaxID=3028027 RepID=A0AAV9IJ35_9RHOD|nr:hypothetical protein GAYE_SCF38G5279 [Galdieria yellowstonensis]
MLTDDTHVKYVAESSCHSQPFAKTSRTVLEPRFESCIEFTAELTNLIINLGLILSTQVPFRSAGIQRHKKLIHVRILEPLAHKRARRPAISDSTLGLPNSVYKAGILSPVCFVCTPTTSRKV